MHVRVHVFESSVNKEFQKENGLLIQRQTSKILQSYCLKCKYTNNDQARLGFEIDRVSIKREG